MAKNQRQLERIVKGFANHRRIEVLFLLDKRPDLSVLEICEELKVGFKTAAAHLKRMADAGLLAKSAEGRIVRHKLTARGESALALLGALD
jgi:predicted transcriptional regulator